MLGIICNEDEKPAVKEFFELFKTPWDFYHNNGQYTALLATTENIPVNSIKLKIIFNSGETLFDKALKYKPVSKKDISELSFKNKYSLPIYNDLCSFQSQDLKVDGFCELLKIKHTNESICLKINSPNGRILRVGYDLFKEIDYLLKIGQPVTNSLVPALEMHIAVLRYLLVMNGMPVLECPPVPKGYKFMAALTHDVDFVKIKNHFFDKTLLGYMYNTTIGSLLDVFSGKKNMRRFITNLKGFFLLPLIGLGLYKDIWTAFAKYKKLEQDLRSTFFIIPFKGWNGAGINEPKDSRGRAVKYTINEIMHELKQMQAHGFEIGVHGLDAWHDPAVSQKEKERITKLLGENTKMGIRIHWLFFDENSYAVIEESGYYYDSTCGYNETIGFRAGTTQVFCPLQVKKLMELPLHIQDTALFYKKRMNLTEKAARQYCSNLINVMQQFGGVLTILWHMRSIVQDRLWDEFYVSLLEQLKNSRVWIDKSVNIVDWFKKRRSVQFKNIMIKSNLMQYVLDYEEDEQTPELQLRLYTINGSNTDDDGLFKYDELEIGNPVNINLNVNIIN